MEMNLINLRYGLTIVLIVVGVVWFRTSSWRERTPAKLRYGAESPTTTADRKIWNELRAVRLSWFVIYWTMVGINFFDLEPQTHRVVSCLALGQLIVRGIAETYYMRKSTRTDTV